MVIDAARWDAQRIVDCSVIFSRESAYDTNSGSLAVSATSVLLANNSLHYGRTTDVERFFVVYDASGDTPIGLGFGSFGAPQSWTFGLGNPIDIPRIPPFIDGGHIATFEDDVPLTREIDPRVVTYNGMNILPWDALGGLSTDVSARRLYVSTPNHLFDLVNRNTAMTHLDQKYGVRRFQQLVRLPSPDYATVEDVAREYPDESDRDLREAIRVIAQLRYGRPWLF